MLPVLGLASLSLASVGIINGLMSYNNVFADDGAVQETESSSTLFSVNSGLVLSVTLPTDPTTISITPTADGNFDKANIPVTVSTNNPFGYKLNMYAYHPTDTTTPTTSLINTNINTATIDSITGNGITEAQFDTTAYNNKWGFSKNGGDYMPIATGGMLIDEKKIATSTDGSAAGTSTTNLTFGVRLNNDIPNGTYSALLNFVAVADIPNSANRAATFDTVFGLAGMEKVSYNNNQYYAMQDMSSVICDYVYRPESKTDTHDQAQLIDTRDNSVYFVTKTVDGNCWMTQNLDLDLGGDVTLNANNSNISNNDDVYTKVPYLAVEGEETNGGYEKVNGVWTWTKAPTTLSTITDTGTIQGYTNSQTAPYSADPGDWYWIGQPYNSESSEQNTDGCGTNDDNQACSYLKGNGNSSRYFKKDEAFEDNGEHGHVGNYYNWTASIASSNSKDFNKVGDTVQSTFGDISKNPVNSICPKGWRLPTIGNGNNGNTNEFDQLITYYNDGIKNGVSGQSIVDDGLVNSPLYFVRGGYVNSGTLYGAGRVGYYWSSTVESSGIARHLLFRTGSVIPASSYARNNGFSVRCVAE